MAAAPEGTVTLLFTDIEGSTRLLARTGERYADLLAVHHRLLRRVFDAGGGYEVDTAGDAFFVAFGSAKEAVAAAAEAQQALAGHDWPEGERMWVRMGLHTGEPRLVGGTYVGLDVHHAARVMAAGHGGQVLVSQSTRDLLGEHAHVRDLGEHRLKDLSLPQRLYQLQVEGLPVEFPALKTLENRPTNLPIQPTPMIGREQELAEVAALLERDDVRLLTLTGPGGTGKTRLALQAAANLVEEFVDGVYFVPLATVTDPDLVVPTLAQILGLREQPEESLADTVGGYLREREMLLLLDNLEQIPEAATDIARLLAAAPRIAVLATSRQALNVSGERLYTVPPLGLPDLNHVDAETIRQNESVRLFTIRAESIRQDFALTDGNAQAVAEICVRLDGLPLALELAAARVRVLSPQAILARLDQRLKLLTGGSKDLDQRQQTLRATIEWSYDLLSAREQLLFARLGVFVGGCRLDAAEAVCDPDGDLGIDVFDGITSLVEKSLLRQRDDPDGEPRFWMLETIREYALDCLRDLGQLDEVATAHAHHYAGFALDLEPEMFSPQRDIWNERFDVEVVNLRDAISSLRRSGHATDALNAASAVAWLWRTRGRAGEGRASIRACLDDLGRPDDPLVHGRALCALAFLALERGDLEEAARDSSHAARLLSGTPRDDLLVESLCVSSAALSDLGRAKEAMEVVGRAEAAARVNGNVAVIVAALSTRVVASAGGGDLQTAGEALEEILALGSPVGAGVRAITLLNFSELKMALGDFAAAEAALDEASTLVERHALRRERPFLILKTALLMLLSEPTQPEAAKGQAEEVLTDVRARGDQVNEAAALVVLASAEAALGEIDAARAHWQQAQAIRSTVGLLVNVATEAALEAKYLHPLIGP
jgi:predicted ATPase/class 3 adenylate cyclase